MQQIYSNFIEITLWHGCSPVNLLHIFRTPFSKNTSRWLLLSLTTLMLNEIKKTILSRRVTIVLSDLCHPLNLLESTNRLELQNTQNFEVFYCIKWYKLWNIGTSEVVCWILLKRLRLVKLISLRSYIFSFSYLLIAGV